MSIQILIAFRGRSTERILADARAAELVRSDARIAEIIVADATDPMRLPGDLTPTQALALVEASIAEVRRDAPPATWATIRVIVVANGGPTNAPMMTVARLVTLSYDAALIEGGIRGGETLAEVDGLRSPLDLRIVNVQPDRVEVIWS